MRLRVIKWVRVALTLLVLGLTLRGYDGTRNSDAEEFLAWSMLALGFPSSVLYSAAFAAMAALLATRSQSTIDTTYVSILASWVVLFLLGYLQWFVLVPWLFRKLRASGGPRHDGRAAR